MTMMTFEQAEAESSELLDANCRREELNHERASRCIASTLEYAKGALDYASTFGFYDDVAFNYREVERILASFEAAMAGLTDGPRVFAENPGAYQSARSLTWRSCELIRVARRRRREQLRVILFPHQHV